jgi:glycosyltransferase involved in cell wall biosynthesis
MRVIFITPGFPADESDHNCIPTMQLFAEALLEKGLDVQVISLDYPFRTQPYQWKGARVFPCNGGNKRWLKPRTMIRALLHCRQLMRGFSAKNERVVLHSFWLGWSSALGEWMARLTGIRHITTLMGQDVLPPNKHWAVLLNPERTRRMVALSSFQNELFKKSTGWQAAQVIPFGVAEKEMPQQLMQQRPVDIIGVGSMIPLKNWRLWLEVVAQIKQQIPIRAMLIGDGRERQRLEQLAHTMGLEETVCFAGEWPRPQVLEQMQQAKILLHTSNYESQGYVMNEAQMNGCQVVSTPVGIAVEWGLSAETRDALAQKTLEAMQNPRPILFPFLMEETANRYWELYTGFDGQKV